MSEQDVPRRAGGPTIHAARVIAGGALALAAIALASVALTVLSPQVDGAILGEAARLGAEGDWGPLLERLAQADAAMARGYWAVLGAAGLLLMAAIAVSTMVHALTVRAAERLADSIVEASRSEETAIVWGRDRRDAFGVIARAVEFLQWERLEAGAAAAAAEAHTPIEVMDSAAAKAVKLQDALSRTVSAASRTCNDFQTVLDRAEKALAHASNAAWDGAAAQREEMERAIAQLRHVVDAITPPQDETPTGPTSENATPDPLSNDMAGAADPLTDDKMADALSAEHAAALADAVRVVERLGGALAQNIQSAAQAADTLSRQSQGVAAAADGLTERATALGGQAATMDARAAAMTTQAEALAQAAADAGTHQDDTAERWTETLDGVLATLRDTVDDHKAAAVSRDAQTLATEDAPAPRTDLALWEGALDDGLDRLLTAAQQMNAQHAALAALEPAARASLEEARNLAQDLRETMAASAAPTPTTPHDTLEPMGAEWPDPRLDDAVARLEAMIVTLGHNAVPMGEALPEAEPMDEAHAAGGLMARIDDAALRLETLADIQAGASHRHDEAAEALRQSVQTMFTERAEAEAQPPATPGATQHASAELAPAPHTMATPEWRALEDRLADLAGDTVQAVTTALQDQATMLRADMADWAAQITAPATAAPVAADATTDIPERLHRMLTDLRVRLDALDARLFDQLNAAQSAFHSTLETAMRDTAAQSQAQADAPPQADAAAINDWARAWTEGLEKRLQGQLAPLTRLDALAAQIRLLEDRVMAHQGESTAPQAEIDMDALAAQITRAVGDTVGQRVEALEVLAQKLEETAAQNASAPAPSTPHATPADEDALSTLPDFAPERALFQRMSVAFNLVLRDLGAQARRLSETVDAVADAPKADATASPAGDSAFAALEARLSALIAQCETTLAAAVHTAAAPRDVAPELAADPARDTAPADIAATTPDFRADQTEFQRMVVGFRHVLRELDAQARALRDTVNGVAVTSAPATPKALEGEILPPPTTATPADRTAINRVVDGLRTAHNRLDVEADALHAVVTDLQARAAAAPTNAGPAIAHEDAAADALSVRFSAIEERLADLAQAVQHAAADNVRALRDAMEASAPHADERDNTPAAPPPADAVLRRLDALTARSTAMNEAVLRQSDLLRALLDEDRAALGDKAEALTERLERAARDARAQTTEFLSIAAALSRDLDAARTDEPRLPAPETPRRLAG